MSASKKQIAANRQNAKKSTGPKTAVGKNAVAQNALKHGLHSQHVVIDAPRLKEDPAEFEALLEELYAELRPQSTFQEFLVRKIAVCLWRSRRAVIAETAQINDQISEIDSAFETKRLIMRFLDNNHEASEEHPEEREKIFANQVGLCSIPSNSRDILYYEMRLDRQMARSYHLLHFLQSQNTGRLVSEAVSDVNEQETDPSVGGPVPSQSPIPDPQTVNFEEEAAQNFKKAKTKPISSNRKEA